MNKCQYCKEPAELTREHVIPVSKGGCNHSHNILHVCESCNKKRGNMPMYQFLQINEKNIQDIVARKIIRSVDCLMNDFVKKRRECAILRANLDYQRNLKRTFNE